MKYLLIMNPGSKGGNSLKQFKKIIDIFNEEKVKYDLKITDCLEDAYIFSLEGNKKGYDVIVAVGGDGTINRVINGFFGINENKLGKAKLGIIYTGTSPDFCKSYNIPLDIENAAKTILKNKTIKIDIGKIIMCREFDSKLDKKSIYESNDTATKYFACCMNVGIGPTLARYANSGIRKKLGDFLGTFLSLLKTLKNYKGSTFNIVIDKNIKNYENVYNISIGKTFYIASGIKVKNNLKEGENKFYYLIVQNVKLFNLVDVLKRIYSGKEIKNDDVISLNYCENIEIYGNNICSEIEFDGDAVGFLPCKVQIAENKLDVITR